MSSAPGEQRIRRQAGPSWLSQGAARTLRVSSCSSGEQMTQRALSAYEPNIRSVNQLRLEHDAEMPGVIHRERDIGSSRSKEIVTGLFEPVAQQLVPFCRHGCEHTPFVAEMVARGRMRDAQLAGQRAQVEGGGSHFSQDLHRCLQQ